MKNRRQNWFWGIFFLIAAALIIVSQLGLMEGINIFTLGATILLAGFFIQSLMHVEFFGIFMSIAVTAILYAKPLGITAITPWPVLIAALFATIGCYVLFNRKGGYKGTWSRRSEYHNHEFDDDDFVAENVDGNEINCKVDFGASSKYLYADSLKRAKLSCSFGAMKVYFDNVTVDPNGAEVKVSCSFGSVQLFIPREWAVKDRLTVSIGGIKENGRASVSEDSPVITLTGSVSLGGMEITYI